MATHNFYTLPYGWANSTTTSSSRAASSLVAPKKLCLIGAAALLAFSLFSINPNASNAAHSDSLDTSLDTRTIASAAQSIASHCVQNLEEDLAKEAKSFVSMSKKDLQEAAKEASKNPSGALDRVSSTFLRGLKFALKEGLVYTYRHPKQALAFSLLMYFAPSVVSYGTSFFVGGASAASAAASGSTYLQIQLLPVGAFPNESVMFPTVQLTNAAAQGWFSLSSLHSVFTTLAEAGLVYKIGRDLYSYFRPTATTAADKNA